MRWHLPSLCVLQKMHVKGYLRVVSDTPARVQMFWTSCDAHGVNIDSAIYHSNEQVHSAIWILAIPFVLGILADILILFF